MITLMACVCTKKIKNPHRSYRSTLECLRRARKTRVIRQLSAVSLGALLLLAEDGLRSIVIQQ